MSRANPFMPYSTRSGISVIARRDENTQNGHIEQQNTKNEDIKDGSIKNEDESATINENSGSESEGGGVDLKGEDDVVKEEDDVGLDRAILDQIKELTDRVDITLSEEERCWYELESPHCRNRREPFILKSRLDVIDSIMCYQIKELLEVVKEVSVHYADAIDKVTELRKEVSELKAQLEIEEDDSDINDDDSDSEIKNDDSDVDMDNDNGVKVDLQSVADFIDDMSLMA